jgi:anti-anti-sigma factor
MAIERVSDSLVVVHLNDHPQFTADLETAAKIGAPTRGLVLDFGAVRLINSSDIAALLRLRKYLITIDIKLVLCDVRNLVRGVFVVTGLEQVFQFAANVTEGIEMVRTDPKKRS